MYCAALAQGVPFNTLDKLKEDIRGNLVPSQVAVDVFTDYMKLAAIKPAPVEEMMRQHMAHYFTYRYQARLDPAHTKAPYYLTRRFFKDSEPNFGDTKKKSTKEYLQDTQQHFIAILSALNDRLNDIMKNEKNYTEYIKQPFQDTVLLNNVPNTFENGAPNPVALLKVHLNLYGGATLVALRSAVIADSIDKNERDELASQIQETMKKWREWLAEHHSPELMDADAPERDILSIADTLSDKPQDPKIVALFDDWVHDSVAGIAHDNVNEFVLFGVGIAKFRRIFFGNNEDAMIKEKAKNQNEQRIKIAQAQLAQEKANAKFYADEAAAYQQAYSTSNWQGNIR